MGHGQSSEKGLTTCNTRAFRPLPVSAKLALRETRIALISVTTNFGSDSYASYRSRTTFNRARTLAR